MARLGKLDRLLELVHALAEDAEGLTIDQMASRIGVSRRTAERMRDVIESHFALTEQQDGRGKRWRIEGRLSRMFTLPTADELAAVQAEIDALREARQEARAGLLSSLLEKVRGAMDTQSRNRTSPDFEALSLAQRVLVPAGPHAHYLPEILETIHSAIKRGVMVEFDYRAEGRTEAAWRRVIPYGILHGSISYLIGAIPGREGSPVLYRLDRMSDTEATDLVAVVPSDFNLPEWCQDSFGVWRDGPYEISLRIAPEAAERAKNWRFHPCQKQRIEAGGAVVFSFKAGGLQELTDHLFCWGDDVEILEPRELKKMMADRLKLALAHHAGGKEHAK